MRVQRQRIGKGTADGPPVPPLLLRSCAMLALLLLIAQSATAAEVVKTSFAIGESVLIRTTPGALDLTISFGDQAYRFLGEPDATIAFRPSTPGAYLIEETIPDGAVIRTRFEVLAPDAVLPAGGAPILTPTTPSPGNETAVIAGVPTDGALDTVTGARDRSAPQELESDERPLSALNAGVRIRTGRGTGIVAAFSVRPEGGGLIKGSTADLGARLPTSGKAEVTFDLPDRHVTRVQLRGVDLAKGVDLGVDDVPEGFVDAPVPQRVWTTVYAIDPIAVTYDGGELRAIASGTELYKCAGWNFASRTCTGEWVKLMDLVPGEEYAVQIGPTDPGFAESTTFVGHSGQVSQASIIVTGSMSAPLETTNTEWSAVVFNPTDRTLNITKVIFSASANAFGGVTGVSPGSGWSATAARINWTGSVVLGPKNATQFIVNARGASTNLANIQIEVNATTNESVLTAPGYLVHTRNAAIQSPSVYFVDTGSAQYVRDDFPDVTGGYTIAVDNVAGAAAVPLTTSLYIRLPPEWSNVSIGTQSGWTVGTVMGDAGSGWVLAPRVATTTIAAGGTRNLTFSAMPPDRDDARLYRLQGLLLGPAANAAISIGSWFQPALRVGNLTERLLDADDDRYATTWTVGGSRSIDHYLGIPAPIDSVGSNTWGVVVVNPTDEAINVTQIDIQTSINMFSAVSAQDPAVTWTLVSASNVRWNGTLMIPPRSARSFAANITSTAASNSVGTVTVTTVTNVTTLTTTGFITSMSTGNIQQPSIFGMNATGPTYLINNIIPGQSTQYRIKVSNKGSSAAVPTNTMLEILLPPGWANVSIPSQTNWTVVHASEDEISGATIRAVVAGSTIGTTASRDFYFNATAPPVGANSTYRFDMRLFGPTGQTTTQSIQSVLQLAVRVTPTSTGINITRASETFANISNISSISVLGIVKANRTSSFTLALLNTSSGAYDAVMVDDIGTTEEAWDVTLHINRTTDIRRYVNSTTGIVIIRWSTTTPNVTALHEEYLVINATYDTQNPAVTQEAPNDTFYTNLTNVTFSYNASDDTDLRNCTLLVNGTANQTNSTPANASVSSFIVASTQERTYWWAIRCIDLNDHVNTTSNRTIVVDRTLPRVNLTSPANLTRYTVSSVVFTILPNDTNIANCSIIIDNTVNQTNTTPISGTQVNFTVDLPDGNTTWTAECTDLAGNTLRNASIRTVLVDTASPAYADLATAPASGGTYNASQKYGFSVNWTDANGISTVIFESNFTDTLQNRTVNLSIGNLYIYNFTTIAAGTYAWRMYANDTFGNRNVTPIATFTIVQAAANTSLLLNGTQENYPADINETINITGILNLPQVGYLEIYVNNVLYASGGTPLQNITSFATNGNRNVTLVFNETRNFTAVNVTLRITVGDKAGPNSTAIYPAEGGYANAVDIIFRFNSTDATGIDNCTLLINGSVNGTNLSGLVNGGENTVLGTGFSEGTYRWRVSCTDPIGNKANSTNTTFTVDLTSPAAFNLLTPGNGTVSRNQSPTLTWEQSADAHFANYTIFIDNAADFSSPNYVNSTAPATAASHPLPVVLLSGTVWWWKVIAWDLAENAKESNGSFTYTPDLDAPQITLQAPGNNTYLSSTDVNITYLISDVSTVANCTLLWNDSTTAVNTTLNQSGMNRFVAMKTEGTYTFSILCVDVAQNEAESDTITVTLDVTSPTPVNLTRPLNGTVSNNNTPRLNWTQSVDANFANYTILVSDNESFPYANYTYLITDIVVLTYQVITPWDDGVWWWKVIAWDLAGNSADPGHQYILDSTPPGAFGLLTPADGTSSTNRTPTLVWDEAPDVNFDNYTIIVDDAADFSSVDFVYERKWQSNTTLVVPIQWTDNTIWHWRVIAYDNATNSRNSSTDFTYITDSASPIITLIDPVNDALKQTNSSLISFTYNITDLSDIASCILQINDSGGIFLIDEDPFVQKDQNQTFTESLPTGDYNWTVACTDAAGNNASGARWALSVNVTLPTIGFYDSDIRSSPQENLSLNTAAMGVYATNNGTVVVPAYRTWNGSEWSAQTYLPYGGSPSRWVRVVANPLLGKAWEQVAAIVGDDGNIDGYVWNGTNWTLYPNIADIGTTRNAQRSFDLAFERQRGRAVLLYSVNAVSGTQDLAYRIWNGSAWESAVNVNDPSASADLSVSFIRLASDPDNTSNEITAAYIDVTNSDGKAMVWTGTSWGSFRNITNTVSITTEEDIAVAYEQKFGGVLAVAGTGSTVAYAYWNGSAWNQSGTTDINPSAAGTTNWLTLSANPAGNHLMIVGADGSNDLSTALWSGGAWSGAVRHDGTIDGNAQRLADFAWDQDGDAGVLAWGTTTSQVDFRDYSVGSSWFAPSSIASGGNTHAWILAVTVPTALSSGSRVLVGAQQSNNTLDGLSWSGSAFTNINSAFTSNQGSVTYQRFDISPEWYAPRVTQERNITLVSAPDGTANIIGVWSAGGLELVSNATGLTTGNFSANGYYIPFGAGARFSALVESTPPGVSYLSWELYIVNESGETLVCAKGNRSRGSSSTAVSATGATTYTGTCLSPVARVLKTNESFRAYVWVNTTANNTITKTIDHLSTFLLIEGYPIGNLTVRAVAPTSDPHIGEGSNLTFVCEIGCSGGYCLDVQVHQQLNSTPTAFNDTDYFTGNLLLNSTSFNPALLGNINTTVNATFNLTGGLYSINNTLRCFVESLFQNVTSEYHNVSVMDNIAPNITLISPGNGTGYDPGNITFTINASDRRLGSCTLWTNTTGTWAPNLTFSPENYTITSIATLNVSGYGTYKWNVNCSDTSGNDTYAPENFTFVIAGDIYVNASEISFSPASPIEGENTTILAIIRNKANRVETDVKVAFYVGNFDDGVQIGENQTILTLPALGTAVVNVSFNASIGTMRFTVIADPPYGNGSIFESDETNNRAETELAVLSWQVYYGNVSGNITLATGSNFTLTSWFITNNTGNIYIADTDTMNGISFSLLRALGRNTSGGVPAGSVDDFTELDTLLNGTNLTDNVNSTFTAGGSPVMLGQITVRGLTIANVPLANTSTDGNHTTGILWDADDSLDAVFDATDQEDVVFVTHIERNMTTTYGSTDYAIRIPARVKSYRGTVETVTLYYELE